MQHSALSWFVRSSQRYRRLWRYLAGAIALLTLNVGICADSGSEPKLTRRILILNEVGPRYPLIKFIDDGIQSGFANSPYNLEFYREYMETILFPDSSDQQLFRDFVVHKYQDRRPDIIIAVGSTPAKFMMETHRTSFPGARVVFCYSNVLADNPLTLDPETTAVGGDLSPARTIDAALRLLPDTAHLVVVTGVSSTDRHYQAMIKEQLRGYDRRLDISYLTDLPLPSVLERLRHLPSHSIVLIGPYTRDTAGPLHSTSNELGPMLVDASNAPVFSLSDRFLNHGEVGGDVSRAFEQGKLAAGLALRLLNGERNVPPVKASTVYMFDWRALQRWGLKENNLPPGSIVLNREPGFWEVNRQYIIAGILLFLAQAVAILALLLERARRRKTEADLIRSEDKFSKAFRHSPLAIIIFHTKSGRYVEVNETFEQETGWSRDEVIGKSTAEVNFWAEPSDHPTLIDELLANGNVRDWEIPIRRKDGQSRIVLGSAELIEVSGEPCALLVVDDITDRKKAEEALSTVSRRLIEAQEAERTRIARELHDDASQRIAMVALHLKTLEKDIPSSDGKAAGRIQDVYNDVMGLGNDIHALSHRLHSSQLEYLGLESASAGFCRELSEQQKVEITFSADGIPESLPGDVSLCLFRVLQEALNNAVKHSGVSKFTVSLRSKAGEIQLLVRDSGIGFDSGAARRGHGLGLTSMTERLRLVNGELSVDSKPNHGTTIFASVPLSVRELDRVSQAR